MSEGAAEGGAPISDAQFGDVTTTSDVPVPGGETAQNPGDGIFAYGYYPWYIAQNGGRPRRQASGYARRLKNRREDDKDPLYR